MSTQDAPPATSDPNWSRRIVAAAVLVVALALIALLGASFLPRWWAHRIGDQVQGSITTGLFVGLFYGFVFTLLPLVVLWLAFRLFESWKARVAAIAVVVLLATPNLLTLGIVAGRGNGAHAGDRTLDVEAPAFRGGTLVGALLAAGCVLFAWHLISSRRRAVHRADAAEASRQVTP